MKEIAIVTKNKRLGRFIELEVLSCGAEARIFSSMPKDTSGFFLVFVDLDGVQINASRLEERIVGISADALEPHSDIRELRVLTRPVDIVKLRALILDGIQSAAEPIPRNISPFFDEKTMLFDEGKCSVTLCGEEILLSDYEFRILRALSENAGESVLREELSALIGASEGNMCDVYICRLRKKLERDGERKIIHTVRGKGYMTRYACEEK